MSRHISQSNFLRENPDLRQVSPSVFWELCFRSVLVDEAHLHPCEIHWLVHQDPRGGLKTWRDGHRSIICDKTTCFWINLLYVQAIQ